MSKATNVILYYTDQRVDENIANFCRNNLSVVANGIPIFSVAQGHIEFGDYSYNIEPMERSRFSMYQQIQYGLYKIYAELNPDNIFFAEHDVLYPTEYFNCTLVRKYKYYYYKNKFFMDKEGFWTTGQLDLSTLAGNFKLILNHFTVRLYRTMVLKMKKGGWEKSEPGTSKTDYTGGVGLREGKYPCIDIRHGNNMSNVSGNPIQKNILYWGDINLLRKKMQWL